MLIRWCEEIGSQLGWTGDKIRIVTGSIGALESTIELEAKVESLVELDAAFEKLGTIEAHKAWSKEIEPYIVSATTHWQIFRLV